MREDEDCGVSISCLEDSYLIAEREYDKYNGIIAKLEQQLSEKDKEIEELKLRIEEVEGQFAYECECNKEFVETQNKLEKMSKEFEELKNRRSFVIDDTESDFFVVHTHMYMFNDDEMQEHDNNIRHQVCDEIREKAFRDCIGLNEDGSNFYHYVIRPDVLDKIEKGE